MNLTQKGRGSNEIGVFLTAELAYSITVKINLSKETCCRGVSWPLIQWASLLYTPLAKTMGGREGAGLLKEMTVILDKCAGLFLV